MFDLTGRSEVTHLVGPIRIIDREARRLGLEYLIVGATARDIVLQSVHGLEIRRATADLDIAVAVRDWSAYEALRSRFPHLGNDPEHRVHVDGSLVDLVPFGGVERADRTIVWPPADAVVMSAFGMTEALAAAENVRLQPDLTVKVASLPAQVVLKIMAWQERHLERRRHDSVDIEMIMKSYSEPWNVERIYARDGIPLLERNEYDVDLTGAMLLGTDVRSLLAPQDLAQFRGVVAGTLREAGGLPDDMPGNRDVNERLLRAFHDGLELSPSPVSTAARAPEGPARAAAPAAGRRPPPA